MLVLLGKLTCDWVRLVSTTAVYFRGVFSFLFFFRGVFSNSKDNGSFDFRLSSLISIYLVSMQMKEPIHERRKTPVD